MRVIKFIRDILSDLKRSHTRERNIMVIHTRLKAKIDTYNYFFIIITNINEGRIHRLERYRLGCYEVL